MEFCLQLQSNLFTIFNTRHPLGRLFSSPIRVSYVSGQAGWTVIRRNLPGSEILPKFLFELLQKEIPLKTPGTSWQYGIKGSSIRPPLCQEAPVFRAANLILLMTRKQYSNNMGSETDPNFSQISPVQPSEILVSLGQLLKH